MLIHFYDLYSLNCCLQVQITSDTEGISILGGAYGSRADKLIEVTNFHLLKFCSLKGTTELKAYSMRTRCFNIF